MNSEVIIMNSDDCGSYIDIIPTFCSCSLVLMGELLYTLFVQGMHIFRVKENTPSKVQSYTKI